LVVSFLKLAAINMAQSKLTTFFKSAASNGKCFRPAMLHTCITNYMVKLNQRWKPTIAIAVLRKKRVEVNTKKVTVLPVLMVSVFLIP